METGKSIMDLTVRELFDTCQGGERGDGFMVSRLMKRGGDPVGAIILVVGDQETADMIDSVNRQLEIWKKDEKPARYVDEKGRIVSVSSVRGYGTFCAFVRDPENYTLDILKAREVPAGRKTFAEAQKNLDAYAQKKGWAAIPDPEAVLLALSQVMGNPPDLELISSWSEIDRVRTEQWASLTHVKAGDNPDQKVPPVPNVLFDYVRGAA